MNTSFDIRSLILSLVVNGGLAMIVSGWVSSKWTQASGTIMILQTWAVAMILTAGASVLNIIPLQLTDFWLFIRESFVNGVLANILYKLGLFDNLLKAINAKSAHQLSPPL